MPVVAMQRPKVNEEREFRYKIKDILASAGMTETYNYSFVNSEQVSKLGESSERCLKLANPLTKEHTLLRTNLKSHLLENIVTNQRNFDVIKLFEIGSVFFNKPGELYKDNKKREKLPQQESRLCLVHAEKEIKAGANFRKLQGVVELLGDKLGVEFNFIRSSEEAMIMTGRSPVGSMQIIDEGVSKKMGIKTDVVICELQLSQFAMKHVVKQYQPKNKFPYLIRDMAFVVDEKIVYNDFRQTILSASALVKTVEVFDVYVGAEVGAGKKNIAMHITFGSGEKTLTGAEADDVQKEIVSKLKNKLAAELRSKT